MFFFKIFFLNLNVVKKPSLFFLALRLYDTPGKKEKKRRCKISSGKKFIFFLKKKKKNLLHFLKKRVKKGYGFCLLSACQLFFEKKTCHEFFLPQKKGKKRVRILLVVYAEDIF